MLLGAYNVSGKRVAVFGPSGMLGKHVMRELASTGNTGVPIHRRMFELLNPTSIRHIIDEADVEAIINCAGVIPVRSSNVVGMIQVNSIFPHILVNSTSGDPKPVILISTDCVFSGRNRYKYVTDSIPDPRDYYGRSKALGEVLAGNAMVIRTSFIGCEHGLMNMVLSAGRTAKELGMQVSIDGWKNALWTGSTVQAVATSLVDILVTDKFKSGIAHLSSKNTATKFDVVSRLVEMNAFDVIVKPVTYPTFNRALMPSEDLVLQDVFEALEQYKCSSILVAA